jgi:hypothetical protein
VRGKRGVLAMEVEVVQTRKFQQFADPPAGLADGPSVVVAPAYTVTMTTGPATDD